MSLVQNFTAYSLMVTFNVYDYLILLRWGPTDITHRHEFGSNFPSEFFKMTERDSLAVFGRFLVRVSTGTPVILSDVYHDFCQSLQESAGI
jgi:hypothetical protein